MKLLARGLATTVLAICLVLAVAVAAGATVYGDYAGDGIRIRTGPHTTNTVLGLGYRGQGAAIFCLAYGTSINGDNLWLRHRNRTTGVTGYSADYYMSWGGGVSAC
jgi:hypothetical protein